MPCLHYVEIIATLTKDDLARCDGFTHADIDRLNTSEVFELDPNELKKAPHLVVTDIYDSEGEGVHLHDSETEVTCHVGFIVETDETDEQKVADRIADAVYLNTGDEFHFVLTKVEGVPFAE